MSKRGKRKSAYRVGDFTIHWASSVWVKRTPKKPLFHERRFLGYICDEWKGLIMYAPYNLESIFMSMNGVKDVESDINVDTQDFFYYIVFENHIEDNIAKKILVEEVKRAFETYGEEYFMDRRRPLYFASCPECELLYENLKRKKCPECRARFFGEKIYKQRVPTLKSYEETHDLLK